MCNLCNYCGHAKHYEGMQRGLMDCDPPEYWCACENEYYDLEDYEIIGLMQIQYAKELEAEGYSEEEAEAAAEAEYFEVECPNFCGS